MGAEILGGLGTQISPLCANRGPRPECPEIQELRAGTGNFVQILDQNLKTGRMRGINLPLGRGDAGTRGRGDVEPILRVAGSPRLRVFLHFPVAALAGGFGFTILLAQHSLARKLDLVAFAANALHENLLSLLQLVAHIFHTTIGDL